MHNLRNIKNYINIAVLMEMIWDGRGCERTYLTFERHAPYFGLTIVLPAVISSLMTSSSFLLKSRTQGVYVCVFSVLLQGLCARDLLLALPPSTGSLPNIGNSSDRTEETLMPF